nr:LysR substrate-binding domain-containing protein [Thalassotalea sp. Y01]
MEQSKVALSIANQQKISFNIAATPNVWDAFFSNRIHDAIELLDNVSLSTEISVREAIQRKLDDRTLDVGMLMDPIKDDEFTNELIGHFDLSLVGSRSTFDKNVEDYILVDWGITFQKEHVLHHKVTPNLKTSTAMIALEVILSKGGFAYLPTELITQSLESQELFEIEAPVQIKRPIFMVYRKSNANNELISQFKNLLMIIQ